MSSYALLADELLVEIFCMIPEPQNLTLSCSRFQKISQDPWTRSKYFMQYGKVSPVLKDLGHLSLIICIVLGECFLSGAVEGAPLNPPMHRCECIYTTLLRHHLTFAPLDNDI